MVLREWLAFYSVFFECPPKWCAYSTGMAGATWNCCRRSVLCVYHTTMHRVTSCKATYVRYMRDNLAVTCQLHFWQNDQDILHAIGLTRGWNGYWNKNEHRKLTLEKKILAPLLLGLEPVTFQPWVRSSTTELPPLPKIKSITYPSQRTPLHLSVIHHQTVLQHKSTVITDPSYQDNQHWMRAKHKCVRLKIMLFVTKHSM